MLMHMSNPGFWGVFVSCIVTGGNLIKWAVAHSHIVRARWKICLGCGVSLVVVGVGLPIWAYFDIRPGVATFASPEPEETKIQISVETAPTLPDIDERAIVNPELAGDLVEEWDTLSPKERKDKLEELLDEPGTRVWTKPTGSDTYDWFHWKDLAPRDKVSIQEVMPELTPISEF